LDEISSRFADAGDDEVEVMVSGGRVICPSPGNPNPNVHQPVVSIPPAQ
jgi:hypothetical protein